MRAAFAEIEITPPVGTHKIGWLKDVVSERVADPLFARVAVFEGESGRIGFIQLDTLSIRWTQVDDIRRRIEKVTGFPPESIMVSATHNHAGPAVSATGLVKRDDGYVELLVRRCVDAFATAVRNLVPATIGFGHASNTAVGKNRRVVLRDGTVRTHGTLSQPDALYIEGPMDPEVAVLSVRDVEGIPLGCIVNYACHPTHLGDGPDFSAGFPGVLCAEVRKHGCPITLFLNGASGNIHTSDPCGNGDMSMYEAGEHLGRSVNEVLTGISHSDRWSFCSQSQTLQLDYRELTHEEITGTIRGAQRFVDPAIYDTLMPRLIERVNERKVQPAEVQVLFFCPDGDEKTDRIAIAGIPAEYFVEFGLRIKSEVHAWCHALVASCANGMIGYVPTPDAFARGGYETTLSLSSRMAPGAGDVLADAARDLIRGQFDD